MSEVNKVSLAKCIKSTASASWVHVADATMFFGVFFSVLYFV